MWGYGSVGGNCSLAPTAAGAAAQGGTLTRELAIFGNLSPIFRFKSILHTLITLVVSCRVWTKD